MHHANAMTAPHFHAIFEITGHLRTFLIHFSKKSPATKVTGLFACIVARAEKALNASS